MTAHNIGYLAAELRIRAQDTWLEINEVDSKSLCLVNDLVRNILTGRVKDLTRRVQIVRIFEKQQATSYSAPTKPLAAVQDGITHRTLIERSKRRLKKLNKVDTLY